MTCSGQNARGTWLKVLAINTKYGYVDLPLKNNGKSKTNSWSFAILEGFH